jgi:hypothetical protein
VLFYVELLLQFLRPAKGKLMAQSLRLGEAQLAINDAIMSALVRFSVRPQLLLSERKSAWQRANC